MVCVSLCALGVLIMVSSSVILLMSRSGSMSATSNASLMGVSLLMIFSTVDFLMRYPCVPLIMFFGR